MGTCSTKSHSAVLYDKQGVLNTINIPPWMMNFHLISLWCPSMCLSQEVTLISIQRYSKQVTSTTHHKWFGPGTEYLLLYTATCRLSDTLIGSILLMESSKRCLCTCIPLDRSEPNSIEHPQFGLVCKVRCETPSTRLNYKGG